MNKHIKALTYSSLLVALAIVSVVTVRVPLFEFLNYEPKDVFITMGGLFFGPFASVLVSLVSSFIEFCTMSSTGLWGLLMNVASSISFSWPIAYFYYNKRTFKSLIIGCIFGIASMTIIMLLFNFIITPIYLEIPRDAVIPMLYTVFLPFNLIKGTLNALIIVLLYKPFILKIKNFFDGSAK